MPENEQRRELREHTTRIVGAHVANNPITATDVPGPVVEIQTVGQRQLVKQQVLRGQIPLVRDAAAYGSWASSSLSK